MVRHILWLRGMGKLNYRKGNFAGAPLAQGHDDRRVAFHRLTHARRGAEAATNYLVAAERVHVDNPEVDALTCPHDSW